MLVTYAKKTTICLGMLLMVLLTLGTSSIGKASHAVTIEMTYSHLTGSTYEFTIVFYRKCFGIPAPANFSLGVKSASLGVNNNQAIILPLLPMIGPGILPLEPPGLYNCSSTPPCFQEYVYRGVLDLTTLTPSGQASDWVFYAQECCNGGIDNINPTWMYAESGLNNLDFPAGNDAAFWHDRRPNRVSHTMDTVLNYPIKSVCAGLQVTLKQDVKEYDGDLVNYQFIHPQGQDATPVTYRTGYSFSNPIPHTTPPGFEIDSITGIIHLKAANPTVPSFSFPPDYYLVAIKATEYRTIGAVTKEIGYVIRNLIILIEPDSTCPGNSNNFKLNTKTLTCADTSLVVPTKAKFYCTTADTNASFIKLKEVSTGLTIPVKSVDVLNCTPDSLATAFRVNFYTPLSPDHYYLTMQNGSDGNTIKTECGIEIQADVDTVRLFVPEINTALIEPDVEDYLEAVCGDSTIEIELTDPIYCNTVDPDGTDFILIDFNTATPTVIPIKAAEVLKCKKGQGNKIQLAFDTTLKGGEYTLYVTKGADGNSLINPCQVETPAISIQLVIPELDVDLGPDLKFCLDSNILVILDAGRGWEHHLWNNGDTNQQSVAFEEGTYSVMVEDDVGCFGWDTMIIKKVDCVGIDELEKATLTVYPNPSTGIVYIQNNGKNRAIDVTVLDINGKEIYHVKEEITTAGKVKMDLSALNSGIYFVQLKAYNGPLVKTVKIVLE